MNVFIIKGAARGLLVLALAALIAAAGSAAAAWGALETLAPDAPAAQRRETFLGLLRLCLGTASIAAAGGIYVGLRVAWERPRKREPRGAGPWILLGIPLAFLAAVLRIVTLLAPLLASVGALSALAAAKLLGPRAFPLTPRSWSD